MRTYLKGYSVLDKISSWSFVPIQLRKKIFILCMSFLPLNWRSGSHRTLKYIPITEPNLNNLSFIFG